MQRQLCPLCISYMLDIPDPKFKDWKKCPTCGWCEDKNGTNLIYPNGYTVAMLTKGEADEPDQDPQVKDKKQRTRQDF